MPEHKIPAWLRRDLATSHNNLGEVYRLKGGLENALVQIETALEIRVRAIGSGHPDVCTTDINKKDTKVLFFVTLKGMKRHFFFQREGMKRPFLSTGRR